MGFRFSRRIKILPGIRLNISKSGVSTSVGTRGAWLTIGKRGTRTTVGLPGTGISYTTQQKVAPSEDGGTGAASRGSSLGWLWLVGVLVVMGLLKACTASAAELSKTGSLADALRIIQGKQFVDLTQSFGSESPVWSGFGQATLSAASDPKTHQPYTLEKDGFRTTFYSMVGQYGTHVDPPAHFSADGATMDHIPVKQMILPLVVFDMTDQLETDPNHAWTVDDIRRWESIHGRVPEGGFAALRTDMSKDWATDPTRFKRQPFPAWSLAAVKFLVNERNVTAIGHESLDTDTTEALDSETWLLKSNHWQIEVMANLDKVPATGAVIVVTWPKVENGFGFPARAFAILP